MKLNETHDPSLRSWVDSANEPATDFPLQNLPFGLFRRAGGSAPFRSGVAIGSEILDLAAAVQVGAFRAAHVGAVAAQAAASAAETPLNAFMAAGPSAWSALRLALSRALRAAAAEQSMLKTCLVPQAQAEYTLAAHIGDYTDFYTSLHHATAVGRLFRPDNPLLPNYKWVPIAYHSRCSSIAISGQQFLRPCGQILAAGATAPTLGPSRRLDYELELGVFVGPGNTLGTPIAIEAAESHVFGLCVLNDWSARDIQAWEYQPLGPFLGKNFASTISPWIVTLEALAPYRLPWTRPDGDPKPLPYLDSPALRAEGAFDIELEVGLQTAAMRGAAAQPNRLSRSNYRHAYWTVAQMIAHHTVNGCNLRPGDLIGTGTLSGPTPPEAGSMIELSVGGKQPLTLPNGETRAFIEDGDAVLMRAWCERSGAARLGFGACVSRVLPAHF